MSLFNDSHRCGKRKPTFLSSNGVFDTSFDLWDNRIFLLFVRDRLITIHGERESSDLIWRLNQIIHEQPRESSAVRGV